MLKIEVSGAKIKQRRENLAYCATQKEFAHAIGVSERRLRDIENKGVRVTHTLLIRIAKALSVHPSQLHVAPPATTSTHNSSATPWINPEFLVPRHDTTLANVVKNETELFDLALNNKAVLCHAMVGLNVETSTYLEELLSILDRLCWNSKSTIPRTGSADALLIKRRIRELIVLLKGNDVWTYQTTHFKQLPERDAIPDTPDPFDSEPQLIIAAGSPGEYGETCITIPIDNGQPRICRPHAIFEKASSV